VTASFAVFPSLEDNTQGYHKCHTNKEVNTYLTRNWYHFAVPENSIKRGRLRTGKRSGIWLAVGLAIALHGIFLLLPLTRENQPGQDRRRALEVELATAETQQPIRVTAEAAPGDASRQPTGEAAPKALPGPVEETAEAITALQPLDTSEPSAALKPSSRANEHDLDNLSEMEKEVLTSTILARQYITEESVSDRLFGNPLVPDSSDLQKDFHYPLRPDLFEMLDKPLPDLPFSYTPGLVYFAYEPGLKGDLQRFWDVITPEFGWRTRYGTEVKCALIVIIPGCVWK
jgi:hypothetical protein